MEQEKQVPNLTVSILLNSQRHRALGPFMSATSSAIWGPGGLEKHAELLPRVLLHFSALSTMEE